jgi:hypothetical protein
MLLAAFACLSSLTWAQEEGVEDQLAEGVEEEDLVAPDTKVEPVFPEENEALIFVEGEDAVSTNFTNEPILNYSCSKFRTLQLNRRTGLQGGRSFYATFVLYVEDPGEYELWYGGTPPGPADELLPSYASPFSLSLDGGQPLSVSRESVAVVEQYAPSYYWNYVGDIPLEAGQLHPGLRRQVLLLPRLLLPGEKTGGNRAGSGAPSRRIPEGHERPLHRCPFQAFRRVPDRDPR